MDALTDSTELEFPDEGGMDFEDEDDEGMDVNALRIHASLQQAMLGLGRGHVSNTDLETVDPFFIGGNTNVCDNVGIDDTAPELGPNAPCVTSTPMEINNIPGNSNYAAGRFTCSLQELNILVVEMSGALGRTKNQPQYATGSSASVIKWGKRDELDKAQQRAFEILVATYILTFYADATGDGNAREKTRLKELAQTGRQRGNPLAMFVTGPGGAGKCKSFSGKIRFISIQWSDFN